MIVKNNIVIENARIGFRNFSGKEGQFNPAGRKNFCVFIDTDLAHRLEEDGWNVRWLQPRDENEEKQAYLQVAVSYDNIPPKITIVSSKGKTLLDNESLSILDWVEIGQEVQIIAGKKVLLPLVDLIIRPYNWEVSGKSGVKAYVKTMYITIAEDEFESKYNNPPDSAHDAIGGCGNCEACDGSCTNNGH